MDDFQWNWGAGPVKDDEFRWNWAKANVDPSYKIQGPGIGSLLRAIHPDTQADAIQQMNNNLAADRANIETIAKQGALENDIVNKLYDEQAEAERTANAAQGHKNAAMDIAMRALATGDEGQIKAAHYNLEQQFGKEYADEIMGMAQTNLEESKKQEDNLFKITSSLPELYLKDSDKNEAKANAYKMYRDGLINAKGYESLFKTISAIPSQQDRDRQAKSQGSANYRWEKNKGKQEKQRKQNESNQAASDLGGI